MIRRTAGRLSVVGLTIVMLAAPAPASASPPATDRATHGTQAALAATTCSITTLGFNYALGACQNPDPGLLFRVAAWCHEAGTPFLYPTTSPYVSTFDTAIARCRSIGDLITSPRTEIAAAPGPPPVIHSLTCEPAGFSRLACSLSASGWTQIRWTVNGRAVSRWNNATSIHGSCLTGLPSILIEVRDIVVKVAVSNSDGTTRRQTSVRCVVTG